MLVAGNGSYSSEQTKRYLDLKVRSHFNKNVLYSTIVVQILTREQQCTCNLLLKHHISNNASVLII